MKINIANNEIIHFIGIGGIGMSGLAQIMNNMGFTIQGSDLNRNKNTDRLIKKGIKVYFGHNQKNLSGDYPGNLIRRLENYNDTDFAVYGAGAVGSMSPRTKSKKGDKKVEEMSRGLYQYISEGLRNIGVKYEYKLNSEKYNIEMSNIDTTVIIEQNNEQSK